MKLNLSGQRFGRLLVLGEGSQRNTIRMWNCLCDCGSRTLAQQGNLRNGHTLSCGCMRSEMTIARHTTHGHYIKGKPTGTRKTWGEIFQRCNNKNNHAYKWYGGRGIKVCDRWYSFENFVSDMGIRPEGFSLDRVNSDGNYEPGNCRWATAKEQAQNTRQSKRWLIHGVEYKSGQQAADATGIKRATIQWRVRNGVAGYSTRRAAMRGA